MTPPPGLTEVFKALQCVKQRPVMDSIALQALSDAVEECPAELINSLTPSPAPPVVEAASKPTEGSIEHLSMREPNPMRHLTMFAGEVAPRPHLEILPEPAKPPTPAVPQDPLKPRDGLDKSLDEIRALNSPGLLRYCGDDAAKWARAFQAIIVPNSGSIDEGLMIGWFANAIEHSSDVRRWRKEAAAKEPAQDPRVAEIARTIAHELGEVYDELHPGPSFDADFVQDDFNRAAEAVLSILRAGGM